MFELNLSAEHNFFGLNINCLIKCDNYILLPYFICHQNRMHQYSVHMATGGYLHDSLSICIGLVLLNLNVLAEAACLGGMKVLQQYSSIRVTTTLKGQQLVDLSYLTWVN